MSDCNIELEPSSGCPTCICSNTEFRCPKPQCPARCENATIIFDESLGCNVCDCEPYELLCPMDCVVRVIFDPDTGREICECDPDDIFNQQSSRN